MPLKVAVLANLKKNAPRFPGMSADQWDDLDSDTTVNAICGALESRGHRAAFFEGDLSLLETLPAFDPDICFNICEGHWGDSRESQVPALLEMLRIPYTASKVLTLALTLDKPMTKRVLHYHGLPTPAFQVFDRANELLDEDLVFPLFVKPSREGTGMGVSRDSIAHTEVKLREQLVAQLARYKQPILVERFIRGREVTIGMIGNIDGAVPRRMPADPMSDPVLAGLRFLPPLEVDFAEYPESEGGVYTNRMKTEWAHDFHYHCPAPLAPGVLDRLNWIAAMAFRATGCLDVARVDFRLDADDGDRPYILEINPLPGLYPDYSDLCYEANAADIAYEELINGIVDAACARYGLQP